MLKKATDSLTQVFYSISEKLYAQTAKKPEDATANAENTESSDNKGATEAESEEK